MSRSTINRILVRDGLVTPDPKKRPKSSYIRFEAAHAQRVLAVRLHPLPPHPPRRQPGPDVEIISWLDDHARYALGVTAHRRVTGPIVLPPSGKPLTCTDTPRPRSPTTAWSTPPGSPAAAAAATTSSTSSAASTSSRRTPAPTTPPPAARSNASSRPSRSGSRAQPAQPTTIAELQTLLDALRRRLQPPSPAPVTAAPGHPGDRLPRHAPRPPRPATAAPTPTTASATTSCRSSRQRHPARRRPLRHIGVGRTYARTRVILLVQDLDVRVINAATGELLRELTIDPDPRLPAPDTTRNDRTAEPTIRRSGCRGCPETSHGRADRI